MLAVPRVQKPIGLVQTERQRSEGGLVHERASHKTGALFPIAGQRAEQLQHIPVQGKHVAYQRMIELGSVHPTNSE